MMLLAGWVWGAMAPGPNPQRPIPHGSAESAGFSQEGLDRLHAAIAQQVEQKRLAGVVTLLARQGKIVDEKAYGDQDLTSGAPMKTDTIFRIYSMTKPVTGVAMMMLYEQGKWKPSDPISKFVPQFAHLKVYQGKDANGNPILVEPSHPPTMEELMTHTAGFTYGLFGDSAVDKMYLKENLFASKSLEEMIDKLAATPLLYQPGTRWVYSVSMDIQGYIIEKLSGQPLPEFFAQHILGPLGMKDSGFFVPKDKLSRFATLYRAGSGGELVELKGDEYLAPPAMPSGGGGMVSTAEDYLRFAQMLLNRGELDGTRILSPASVRMMTSNHIAPALMTGEFGIGGYKLKPGLGWGYDCAAYTDPAEAGSPVGRGTFYWDGAADTWFWVDPSNDLIFIGMTQRMFGPNQPPVHAISEPPVYQALVKPKS